AYKRGGDRRGLRGQHRRARQRLLRRRRPRRDGPAHLPQGTGRHRARLGEQRRGGRRRGHERRGLHGLDGSLGPRPLQGGPPEARRRPTPRRPLRRRRPHLLRHRLQRLLRGLQLPRSRHLRL
ncbi:MAG: hypothetical protein AVDCRST_MAG01-01-4222, partial [uncultured Rubrobacteraceae bacterium]